MTKFSIKSTVLHLAIGLGVLMGAQAVSVPDAEAGVQRINCPMNKIRREVTTALPSGWWNTPIVNSLTEVRIQTIGGKRALVCKYGAAGTIQRYAPRGTTCRVNARHFLCASRSAGGAGGSNPGTFSTGPINVKQTFLFDLDRGRVQKRGADIWFQAETARMLYLVPRNGAKIGVGNRKNRGYAGCRRARFSSGRVSLRDIPVGSYVCVKTSQGRVSQFRVNGLIGGSPKTLKIGYTTWKR